MTFARGNPGKNFTSVAALLVAAGATAVALLHPMAVPRRDWLPRAEWVLTVSLVVGGLILTGGLLAKTFADLGSPTWVTITAAYTILGMAGALLLFRRLPHIKWALALFLLAHAAMSVALLRSSTVLIDTQVYLHDGVVELFHGRNPYTMTVRNIYPPALTDLFYGPGVVFDGRVHAGFPYLPATLLAVIPGYLLGDVRYSLLIAMVVTALALRQLASDRIGRAAAVLGVASLSSIPMLEGAWTEPISVALLACLVLAIDGRRQAYTALFLGLLLMSKQYFVVVVPMLWLIRQWLTRRMILIGVGLAFVVNLPFFLVNPAAFWKAVAGAPGAPLRPDSLSLLVFSVNNFGWPPSWTYVVLPLLGGGLTALVLALRSPRTPAAFAAGVGLTLLVTILLSNRAFMNYYFLVSGAFLIAVVAWPGKPGPAKPVSATRA